MSADLRAIFLPLAHAELNDTVAWYREAGGLGCDFLVEFDRAVRRTTTFPLSCPEIEPGLRRCLLARYPYGLIYALDDSTVVILAVAHLHREPRYWVDRL